MAGPEQARVFFNTILPITCSFQHQMDEMAINLLFPGSQLVPNVWGARREVFEGLSLVAPPSCSASWPASLVERVTPVPDTSGQSGSSKTPTKPSNPGAGKLTLGSGKKTQPNIQQAAGMFWADQKKREKEETDARAQEEKHRKKPSEKPILSLDEHEHSISDLTNWATPSRFAPSSGKSSASKDRAKPRKDPMTIPDPSDDEPLLDQANEPKAKARKRDPTPELVIIDEDDSTPLPERQKTPKRPLPVEEEATEALVQCLKGEARAVQYNLELAALVDYRNKSVPNLKGPPNTDDHSKDLSQVRDISWSYPAKVNLLTARQYFQELQACKDREMVVTGSFTPTSKVSWKVEAFSLCMFLTSSSNSPRGPPWNEGHRPKVHHETSVLEVPAQEQHEHSICSSFTNTVYYILFMYTVCGYRTSRGTPDLRAGVGLTPRQYTEWNVVGRARSTGDPSQQGLLPEVYRTASTGWRAHLRDRVLNKPTNYQPKQTPGPMPGWYI